MNIKGIGMAIRQHRKIKGWTQEQLAQKAGLSTMSIRRYEQGERIAPEDVLQRIAAALNVEVIELIPEDRKEEFVEYLLEQIAKGKDVSALKFAPEKAMGTPEQNRRARLLGIYDRILNDAGKKRIVDTAELLARHPDYQRERWKPPQAAPAPQEGNRTTPDKAPSEGV